MFCKECNKWFNNSRQLVNGRVNGARAKCCSYKCSHRQAERNYRQTHADKIKAYNLAYKQAHRDQQKAYLKEYRQRQQQTFTETYLKQLCPT